MMKKMSTHKTNKKLLVTAICVATLGAQLSSVMNVQAAVDGQDSSTDTGAVADPTSSESSTPSSLNASGDSTSGSTDANENNLKTGTTTDTNKDGSNSDDSTDPATDITTDKTNGNNTEDIKAKDTDEETAAPVVVNDPNSTKTLAEMGSDYDNPNPVQAQGHIEVSNDNGTAETKGTQDYNGSSIIESNDSNKLSAVYTITDDVPEANHNSQCLIFPTLYLPAYFANLNPAADIVVDKGSSTDASDWQTTLLKNSGLPSNTIIKYTQGTSNLYSQSFKSLTDLGSDFDVSKITGIQIAYDFDGQNFVFMPANTTYTINVPLKVVSNDPYNPNESKIGVSDWGHNVTNYSTLPTSSTDTSHTDLSIKSNRYTSFRIANKLSDVKGQLGAATEQQSNDKYEGVDPDIQALMPTIEKGDVSYQNFDDAVTDSTESNLYSGSTVIVNDQALEKVAKVVNDKGYSLLMNPDGSIGTGNYVYTTSNKNTVTITPNPKATAESTANVAPYVYITLRHLLDTKDSAMNVGDSWNAESSLATITTPQDKATPATAKDLSSDTKDANHVTTKISDPDGVLDKDGKAIKAGSFQVTYLMQDGNYTISKTATVTVNPAKDPSTNNSGNTSITGNNGSNTNTTDPTTDPSDPDTPVVSPSEIPDDITEDDPVVSPNEVPDDITEDDPVVSPNEIPNASELTGNDKSTDSTTQQNDPATSTLTNTNNNNSVISTSNKATNTIANTTANENKTSNNPIYTVAANQNNASDVLTGYTPTSTSQSKVAAQFPQTGNAKDSKLQIIGTMIVSMMATVAGFAFGKKRQTKKA
ncbi:hypothetical protein NBRC111452_1505 [Companilactobacillus farciminis]|nr:hypothetical protein NBRC111452_1505 [Companilactobacillus farciminis]